MTSLRTPYLEKFAVIGDVHGEHRSLRLVLEYLSRQRKDLDAILAVGDFIDPPATLENIDGIERERAASAVIDLLQKHNVICVQGNHDEWGSTGLCVEANDLSREEIEWLYYLPKTRQFNTPQGGLLLCHGVGEDNTRYLRPETSLSMSDLTKLRDNSNITLMIGGHTHIRMVRAFDGLTVINPGTLHRKDNHRNKENPGFIIVDLRRCIVECFDFVSDEIIEVASLAIPILK